MAWTTTNITQDANGKASQTSNANKGELEFALAAGRYPCLFVDEIDFNNPYYSNGGEFFAGLRYADEENNVHTKITSHSNNQLYDLEVQQSRGGVSGFNTPNTPWAEFNGVVLASAADSQGNVYIAGEFTSVSDSGGVQTNSEYIVKVNPNGGVINSFVVTPDDVVRDIFLDEENNTLWLVGDFEELDTAGEHGSSISTYKIAAVSTTDGSIIKTVPFFGGGINGTPNVIIKVTVAGNDFVYVGGDITSIQKMLVTDNDYNNLVSYNANSDELSLLSWKPDINDTVHDLLYDGTYLYCVGEFTEVEGVSRDSACSFLQSNNSLSSWNPNLQHPSGGAAYALALDPDNSIIYVGGFFTDPSPNSRTNIAAWNTQTQALLDFAPIPNDTVRSIDIDTEELSIFIAGEFTEVNNETRHFISELSYTGENKNLGPTSGTASGIGHTVSHNAEVGSVFLGGDFDSVHGTSRDNGANFSQPIDSDINILALTNRPMPQSKKFALHFQIDCGEELEVNIMESESGSILHYARGTLDWDPDNDVYVSLGPAGQQGPAINGMTLRSRTDCESPEADDYSDCNYNTSVINEDFSGSSSATHSSSDTYENSHVIATGWDVTNIEDGWPDNHKARSWLEIWDIEGQTDLDKEGGAAQWGFPWCFEIKGIKDFFAERNKDSDVVTNRYIVALLGGFVTTSSIDGFTYINGLAAKLNFRNNTLSIGTIEDAAFKKDVWQSATLVNSNRNTVIKEGLFKEFDSGTINITNLDKWQEEELHIQVSYACSDMLTISAWGDDGTEYLITEQTVSIADNDFPNEDIGYNFGGYAVATVKNGAVPDDQEDVDIKADLIRMNYDSETDCVEPVE